MVQIHQEAYVRRLHPIILNLTIAMDVQSFAAQIDADIIQKGNEAVLLDTVKWFSQKGHLHTLIDSAWEQNKDTIVEKSFLHLNGFDKLVLVSGKHFNLRIHNFHPTKVMTPAEGVHNHKWEFASSLIHGSYEATSYVTSGGDEVRKHYVYSKDNGLEYQGEKGIQKVDEFTLSKGDSYFMKGDQYHSITKVGEKGCVSVMMTGFTKETTTNVYSTTELSTDPSSAMCGLRMFDAEEIKSVLNFVKELN
jgi:hypothetical protein